MPPPCSARLIARKALFCAGSTSRAGPDPRTCPAGGTIPAAIALVSKPTPGTLSKGAASGSVPSPSHMTATPPTGCMAACTLSLSGDPAATVRTSIWYGSVQPA